MLPSNGPDKAERTDGMHDCSADLPLRSPQCAVFPFSNVGRNSLTGQFPAWFSAMPAITDLYACRLLSIYLSIGRLAPSSAPHLRRCGRLAAENKFSGTLPGGIAQMPSLRQLCAALREPWLLPCFEALALLCRDVRLNFLQGNVTTIARMNGARSFAVCRLPPPPALAPILVPSLCDHHP